MTRDEMMALSENDLVTVKKTGKVYRVREIHRGATPEQVEECRANGWCWWECDGGTFIQQRNGKDYGPIRRLKPENITRA